MSKFDIQNSLIKFLNNSANKAELDALNIWIQDPSNEVIFKNYIKTHYRITLGMNNPDPKEIKERLLKEIRQEKTISYRIKQNPILKYAAVAILFLGLGYFFQNAILTNTPEQYLKPSEEAITLKLENGDVQIISPDGKTQLVDKNGKVIGKQQGTQLVYSNETKPTKLVYNTLTIPYGKKFEITLSDNTTVYLNSGTSLKYPVQFIAGQERQVFLKGEAYFDIAKDEENPFIVNAQELNIQVVGTQFNVVAYPENQETDVVLIEGSVGLSESNTTEVEHAVTYLKPGFKGSFDKEQKTINTSKVNTLLYTSWMDGNIVFRNESFENIIKRLERQYNTTIINNNKSLSNETFNATIEVERETLEDVLYYFNKVHDIEYQIINNKVVIN